MSDTVVNYFFSGNTPERNGKYISFSGIYMDKENIGPFDVLEAIRKLKEEEHGVEVLIVSFNII